MGKGCLPPIRLRGLGSIVRPAPRPKRVLVHLESFKEQSDCNKIDRVYFCGTYLVTFTITEHKDFEKAPICPCDTAKMVVKFFPPRIRVGARPILAMPMKWPQITL